MSGYWNGLESGLGFNLCVVGSDRDVGNLEMSKMEQLGIADGRAGNNK